MAFTIVYVAKFNNTIYRLKEELTEGEITENYYPYKIPNKIYFDDYNKPYSMEEIKKGYKEYSNEYQDLDDFLKSNFYVFELTKLNYHDNFYHMKITDFINPIKQGNLAYLCKNYNKKSYLLLFTLPESNWEYSYCPYNFTYWYKQLECYLEFNFIKINYRNFIDKRILVCLEDCYDDGKQPYLAFFNKTYQFIKKEFI